MKLNPILAADFYKVGHVAQIPATQINTYANFTARSNRHAPVVDESGRQPAQVVVLGMSATAQWFLKDLWDREFFQQPLDKVLAEYDEFMSTTIGPVDHSHVEKLWRLGRLPIVVKTLPEGTLVNMGVPFMTIQHTEPGYAWLAEYLESAISAETWKVMTNATLAFEFKRMMAYYYDLTGLPHSAMLFNAHDFSMRGLNGIHDAAANGIGHLASFQGSDTQLAIAYARTYYDGNIPAGSIPATEHSVTSSNILYVERILALTGAYGGKTIEEWDAEYKDEDLRGLAEYITLKRLLTEVYPSGLVGYVADTFDFWRVVDRIIPALRDVILARTPDHTGMAKLVLRPDSGNPRDIVCGTETRPGVIQSLYRTFGGTTTPTGHFVLNERIGVIYGDSINFQNGARILEDLAIQNFAACNIVFGLGSYFYNGNVTRDTFGMAIKATSAEYSDLGHVALFKDPITDPGKKSARGLLRVDRGEDGEYVLHQFQTPDEEAGGELCVVFKDGVVTREDFSVIRERLEKLL